MTRDNAAMPDYIVVLCACGSESEAETIARQLVELRLAACVNVSPPVLSVYRWQGKVETAAEWLLTIKTEHSHFPALSEAILDLHSYELPEIIALPVVAGSRPYLQWIGESVNA
jgi:periplasmic divalent cation tolerance protein